MSIEIPTREDFDRLVSEVRALRQILEAAQPRDEWLTIEQASLDSQKDSARGPLIAPRQTRLHGIAPSLNTPPITEPLLTWVRCAL